MQDVTREQWLKQKIKEIKNGGVMELHCVMGTPERVLSSLCQGRVPSDRVKKGLETCSPECQADKRRLRRWQRSQGKCRLCGHGLPAKKAKEPKA